MSLASVARRQTPRLARSTRQITPRRSYSAAAELSEGVPTGEQFKAQREAVREHAKETTDLWRKISLFACIPITLVMAAYVKKVEDEHHAHAAHSEGHEVGTPAYSWLNKRQKPYPWGMNSLFWNPAVNRNLEESEE